ncbi:hemerythrin domain-containing protein [Ornithinibacillus gellani]|nr:hemerythrin domain-containing protein [Ornithinibacillus gellani]
MIMATGPALRKLAAHRSIHDGAYAEARDLTDVVNQLFQQERDDECRTAADVLIEYWETRVIAHADAEEEGLYVEIAEENPQLQKEIHMLTRDHDLLRIILDKIKTQFKENHHVTKLVLDQFQSLLIVNEIHSRDEERLLLEE